MTVQTAEGRHIFEVQVYLNGLDPKKISVELYADEVSGESRVRREMTPIRFSEGPTSGRVYRAELPATRPATDYTPRLIPCHPGVAIPLETSNILWRH